MHHSISDYVCLSVFFDFLICHVSYENYVPETRVFRLWLPTGDIRDIPLPARYVGFTTHSIHRPKTRIS